MAGNIRRPGSAKPRIAAGRLRGRLPKSEIRTQIQSLDNKIRGLEINIRTSASMAHSADTVSSGNSDFRASIEAGVELDKVKSQRAALLKRLAKR